MCNGLPSTPRGLSFHEPVDADAAEQIARSAMEASPWKPTLCPKIRECFRDCLLISREPGAPDGEYEVDVLCSEDPNCFASERVQIGTDLLKPKA